MNRNNDMTCYFPVLQQELFTKATVVSWNFNYRLKRNIKPIKKGWRKKPLLLQEEFTDLIYHAILSEDWEACCKISLQSTTSHKYTRQYCSIKMNIEIAAWLRGTHPALLSHCLLVEWFVNQMLYRNPSHTYTPQIYTAAYGLASLPRK